MTARRSRAIGIVLVGIATLVASSLISAPAAAAASGPAVSFLHHATVRASGAGAVVSVRIACPSGSLLPVTAFVKEDFADGSYAVAGGNLPFDFTCGPHAQLVHVPLWSGFIADGTGPFESDLPLRVGAATALVGFSSCLGCSPEAFSSTSPVQLTNSADLDRLSSSAGRLGTGDPIVADGAAVDVNLRETCAAGTSFVASVSGLTQVATRRFVDLSFPIADNNEDPPPCAGHAVSFRVRMYPSIYGLHRGTAFVEYGGLWGQVAVK